MSIAVAVAWAIAVASPAAAAEGHLRLAGGDAQGAYHQVAVELAALLAGPPYELDIEVIETSGSYDNAARLRNGDADLAILQGDVAYLEYFDGRPYRALAALHTEPLHLLARRGLGIDDTTGLGRQERPLRASIGPPGGGTALQALSVLEVLQIPDERLQLVELTPETAVVQLLRRRIDLAFVTSAVPAPQLSTQTGEPLAGAITLLDVSRTTARELRHRVPFLIPCEIPLQAYDFQDHSVQTLGTRALLVSNPYLSEGDVRMVLEALYELPAASGDRLPFLHDLAPDAGVENLAVPLHPASLRYHKERSHWMPPNWWQRWRGWVVLTILGIALVLLATFFSRMAYLFERYRITGLSILILVIWLGGASVMYVLEGDRNLHFSSLGRSLLAILYYLFSGLEARYPTTREGTFVAVLLLSFGVAAAAAFTATIASRFVELALDVRTLRRKPFSRLKLRNHLVITGWSARTRRILRQLRSPEIRNSPTVVVITGDIDRTRVESRHLYPDTWVVEGDPTQADTLRRADVDTASTALILSDSLDDPREDLLSIAATSAIETLNPAIHTIVDIEKHLHEEHLGYCHADETLVNEELTEGFTHQCLMMPGLMTVYDEILSFGRGSQEVYIVPLPGWLAGRPFREALTELHGAPVIPLGFYENGDTIHGAPVLNPEPEQRMPGGTEQEGARLIVLADNPSAMPQRPSPPVARLSPAPEPSGQRDPASPLHLAVCGSSGEITPLVHELCTNPLWQSRVGEVVVIGDPLPDLGDTTDPRVRTVPDNPTTGAALERGGVGRLDGLAVLANDGRDGADPRADHLTLLVCQAARTRRPDLPLVAEVVDPQHRELFEPLSPLDIVCAAGLAEKLLAQTAVNPGISHVYQELLNATGDSSEIYLVPVPDAWEGIDFGRAYRTVAGSAEREILLGFRTHGGQPGGGTGARTVLNPSLRRARRGPWRGREHTLERSDQLVVLARRPPSW